MITAFLLGPWVILVVLFWLIVWTLDAKATRPVPAPQRPPAAAPAQPGPQSNPDPVSRG